MHQRTVPHDEGDIKIEGRRLAVPQRCETARQIAVCRLSSFIRMSAPQAYRWRKFTYAPFAGRGG
jgi:hypothetical protein